MKYGVNGHETSAVSTKEQWQSLRKEIIELWPKETTN